MLPFYGKHFYGAGQGLDKTAGTVFFPPQKKDFLLSFNLLMEKNKQQAFSIKIAVLMGILALCVLSVRALSNFERLSVQVVLSSNAGAVSEMYADFGDGFLLLPATPGVIRGGGRSELAFELGKSIPLRLRFDPTPETGENGFEFEMLALSLRVHPFGFGEKVDGAAFVPVQGGVYRHSGSASHYVVESGVFDPQMSWVVSDAIREQIRFDQQLSRIAGLFMLGAAVLLGFLFYRKWS